MSLLDHTGYTDDMPSASNLEERNLLLDAKVKKLEKAYMTVENLKCYAEEYNLDFEKINAFLDYVATELLDAETQNDVVRADLFDILRDRG